MIIRLMVGDTTYSEFELQEGTPTSPYMAMTMITKAGQTLMMEWEMFEDSGKEKLYALTYAFTVKPQHITSLRNLISNTSEDSTVVQPAVGHEHGGGVGKA